MSQIDQQFTHLSAEEKRALLMQLLKAKANQTKSFPLSFNQQRIWFLDRLDPGAATYTVCVAMHIVGRLQVAAVQHSLDEIVRRHEALRTSFPIGPNDEPVQRIMPAESVPLPIIDVQSTAPAERERHARRIIEAAIAEPFDLAKGPLLRVRLIQLAPTEHVLALTIHHIIFDDWSLGVFWQEFAALYSGWVTQQPPRLAALPIQYADFAVWQRDWLQGAVLDEQIGYWQRQLADAPTLLTLPTDRPRPPLQTFHGAIYRFNIAPALSAGLRNLSQQAGATLFMTLLAAFQVLLARYSGQTSVVVGSPVAGRTRTDLEGLIGLFINMLPLHVDLADNPTFRDLLQRVRDICLNAYAHQDFPPEQLITALQIQRQPSHSALYQVVFDLHNAAQGALSLPGLAVSWWETEEHSAKFDLSLALTDSGQALSGSIEYNTDLFDAATIERMAGHFQILLAGVVEQPDQRVGHLPLLSAAERDELLVTRNATTAAYPSDQCYHQLFAAQVARTPDAPAVRFGEHTLSYAELERRANQLAHYLQQLGVGPEVRVALYLERSLELLVGVLASFKAGGAFVPLDPAFPADRLAYILHDANARVVLTQAPLQERLPDYPAPVVCLDRDWSQIAAQPPTPPVSAVTATNLAYLIYTSGSTGRPKGVLIPHQGLVNYLAWCLDPYTVARGRGAPVHASIAADAIFPSLFAPLLTGTCVFVQPEEHALEALGDALRTEGNFSMVKITPSQLEVLTHALPPQDAQGWVHTLVIGAEEVRGEVLRFWQTHAPATILLNEYGPTETVVGCSIYEVPADVTITGSVPIGLPIANTQFYVLDRQMQPVPIGVAGELFIGGDGVAWGYHGRPDLTAEKFVPDPFAQRAPGQPGARLYRTGDLVRQLADRAGNIVFLGRIDDQVKIRGYRVEPGEIEEVLRLHPAVRDCVVLARGAESHNRRLIAYVVPNENQERVPHRVPSGHGARQTKNQAAAPDSGSGFSVLGSAELREFLLARLPEYMVPSAFVFLEALPLAPHGKIDRKALPLPEMSSAAEQEFAPPRDAIEQQMARIWEQVLDVRPIGRTDDFFALGGHSLLAVRLLSQLQTHFKRSFALTTLFQYPTIARFSELLRQQVETPEWSPLVPLQPAGHNRPFFCVHPTGGQVLGYRELARLIGSHQPFYGLQAPPLANIGDDDVTIEEMAAQYVAAMRTVQPQGPYLIGGWSLGGLIAFEMAQQLHQAGASVALLAVMDSRPPTTLGDINQITDGTVLFGLVKEQALQLGKTLDLSLSDLEQLDPAVQLTTVLEAARAINLDFNTELEWVRRFVRGFRARARSSYAYQPRIYPGRIVLFKTISGDEELNEVRKLSGQDLIDPTYGWDAFSTEPITIQVIPGYHETMLQAPYVQALADQLRAHLDQAQTLAPQSQR